MKSKVLFILHLPPPVHGSSIIGSYIKNSSKINEAFNTVYINLGTSSSINEIGKKGIKKWLLYFKILTRIVKQMLIFKPDSVYIAMTAKGIGFYKDILAIFFIKLFRVQLIIHFHNKGVSDHQNKTICNFLYKWVFKNAKIILLSKYLFSDIKKYVNEDDVYYCPNGIMRIKTNDSAVSDNNYGKLKLLFLSNLMTSKGVFVLLKALSILKKKGVEFSCNFIGSAGDISEFDFRKNLSVLNLDSDVNYLGEKFNEDKEAIFRTSDVFVHPSLNDCFPLVLLEASQFKLPMVSTFEGAIPEIIEDGFNGFLVPKNDPSALAEKLEKLIQNKNLRISLGDAAFEKYEKEYTFSKFENNMCSILKSINSN
ncbi:glycosyltransferase [Winogradskyella sp. PE311]|uniref:glycosyltransferase n=1 Tax=Winogradskyella sp. PE311 TaxID=3366943 RepID=UPI00397FBEF2